MLEEGKLLECPVPAVRMDIHRTEVARFTTTAFRDRPYLSMRLALCDKARPMVLCQWPLSLTLPPSPRWSQAQLTRTTTWTRPSTTYNENDNRAAVQQNTEAERQRHQNRTLLVGEDRTGANSP